MSISFIAAKFIEIILKLFIFFFCLVSTIIFLYYITFGIDFRKVERCIDELGGWNHEERLCQFYLYD
jgi:ATP/ADP translocase